MFIVLSAAWPVENEDKAIRTGLKVRLEFSKDLQCLNCAATIEAHGVGGCLRQFSWLLGANSIKSIYLLDYILEAVLCSADSGSMAGVADDSRRLNFTFP